jgi:hypothetical protein
VAILSPDAIPPLEGGSLPDLDLFQLKGVKGERVTVRLTPGPAGSYTNGNAVLTILGPDVLQIDATAIPNVVVASLPATGRYFVTVSQPLRTSGRFSGAYTVSLESTLGAFATFVAR